jgi:hypothetical protein
MRPDKPYALIKADGDAEGEEGKCERAVGKTSRHRGIPETHTNHFHAGLFISSSRGQEEAEILQAM